MIVYLLKSTLSLLLLLAMYQLFLEHLKMHVFKRFYLLTALLCSLLFPLLKLAPSALLWTATLSNTTLEPLIISSQSALTKPNSNLMNFIWLIYGLGALFLTVRFFINLGKFRDLRRDQSQQTIDGITYVLTSKTPHTFAFWNRIYLPKDQFDSVDLNHPIILHETAHSKQLHSIDITLVEILKIAFWFNPLLYWYKKAISLNHEFLADESVIKTTQNTAAYLEILLQQQTHTNIQSLSSSFYYQPTKKRFLMTTKTIDKRKNILVQAVSSLLLTVIAAFSIQAQTINHSAPSTAEKPLTNQFQVVDQQAKYPGGISEFNKYFVSKFRTPELDSGVAKLIVQFMVEKDGKIDEVHILRGLNEETNQHIVEILKNSIPWIPAEKDGEKVQSLFTIPITIQIDPGSKEGTPTQ